MTSKLNDLDVDFSGDGRFLVRVSGYIWFLSLLAINGCNSSKYNSIYHDPIFLDEIHEVIYATIIEDSILDTEEQYHLVPKVQKYVKRDSLSDFMPGPPPFSPKLFPDVTYYFHQVQIQLKQKDVDFINRQDNESVDIYLDSAKFNFSNLKSSSNFSNQGIMMKFDLPIFSESMEYAFVEYGIYCSGECGMGKILILKREEKGWEIIFEKVNWIG